MRSQTLTSLKICDQGSQADYSLGGTALISRAFDRDRAIGARADLATEINACSHAQATYHAPSPVQRPPYKVKICKTRLIEGLVYILSQTVTSESYVYGIEPLEDMTITRADAPSWGRALASAGLVNLCWQPSG